MTGNVRTNARDKHADYLSGDLIECLICGKKCKSVGNHVYMVHNMRAKQYKEKFGLSVSAGLLGDKSRAMRQEVAKDNFELARVKDVRVDNYGSVEEFEAAKRKIYIAILKKAIDDKVSIYSIYRATSVIIEFIRKYGDESEKQLLREAQKYSAKQNKKVVVKCAKCGTSISKFQSSMKGSKKTYCSKKCRTDGQKNQIKTKCIVCGSNMSQTPSDAERVKCCSDDCKKTRRTKEFKDSYYAKQ